MSCRSSAQILLMSSQLMESSSSPLACMAPYCLSELISYYSSPCTLGSTVGSFLFLQHLTPSLLRTFARHVSLLEYHKHSLPPYLLQVCPNATPRRPMVTTVVKVHHPHTFSILLSRCPLLRALSIFLATHSSFLLFSDQLPAPLSV